MASKRLALELAAAWLPPDCLVPFAAASKGLKALIESNAFWTDFYRRRFPCLAALPGYASPKDARGFVKALLRAVPVDRKYFQPEGSDFGTKPIPKPEVLLLRLLRLAKSQSRGLWMLGKPLKTSIIPLGIAARSACAIRFGRHFPSGSIFQIEHSPPNN